MAAWKDVRRFALKLPKTSERASSQGSAQWRVRGPLFLWERPLRTSDLTALGDAAPTGAIVAARVAGLGVKEALVATGDPYFTTPHFEGYLAILVRLAAISVAELEELIVDAWLARAPKRL